MTRPAGIGWLCRFVLALVLVTAPAVLLFPPPARAGDGGGGVMQSFARAQRAYQGNHPKIAVRLLAGILRRYPDHQPSRLLLAHILLESGKVAAAAREFAHVPTEALPPDAAYEYGAAQFTLKDCRRAQTTLARVPAGSRYASLASFYRGLCDLRARDWTRAESDLGKVADLPPRLEPAYRQALHKAHEYAQAERQGNNRSGGPGVIIIVASAPPAADAPAAGESEDKDNDKEKEKEKPKEKPAETKAPAGWDTAVTPSVTFSQETDTNDFFGFHRDVSVANTTDVDLAVKAKYSFQSRAGGGQPSVSLGADFDDTRLDIKGTSSSYIAYTTDPTNIIAQETPLPPFSEHLGTVTATPEVDWPLGSLADLDLGYKYQLQLPDLRSDKQITGQGPTGSLNIGKTTTLKLNGAQTALTDAQGKPTETDLVYGADLSRTVETLTLDLSYQVTTATLATKPDPGAMQYFGVGYGTFDGAITAINGSATKTWDNWSVTASVKDTTYVPSDAKWIITGFYGHEAENLTGSLSVVDTLAIGGNVTVTGSASQLKALTMYVPDPAAPPAAPGSTSSTSSTPQIPLTRDGTSFSGLASLKFAPVDWAFGLVSFQYSKFQFTGGQPAQESAFEQAVPESIGALKLQVGLTKSF